MDHKKILIYGSNETAITNWMNIIAGKKLATDENSESHSTIKGLKPNRFEVGMDLYSILDIPKPDDNDLKLTKKGIN